MLYFKKNIEEKNKKTRNEKVEPIPYKTTNPPSHQLLKI